jgi:hypothetical protein
VKTGEPQRDLRRTPPELRAVGPGVALVPRKVVQQRELDRRGRRPQVIPTEGAREQRQCSELHCHTERAHRIEL